jgi:hypothetical protein
MQHQHALHQHTPHHELQLQELAALAIAGTSDDPGCLDLVDDTYYCKDRRSRAYGAATKVYGPFTRAQLLTAHDLGYIVEHRLLIRKGELL